LTTSAKEVMQVIDVVNTWQDHFAHVGICLEDIDSLALRIDGAFLRGQCVYFDIATYKI